VFFTVGTMGLALGLDDRHTNPLVKSRIIITIRAEYPDVP